MTYYYIANREQLMKGKLYTTTVLVAGRYYYIHKVTEEDALLYKMKGSIVIATGNYNTTHDDLRQKAIEHILSLGSRRE